MTWPGAMTQTSGIAPLPPRTTDDWLRVLTRRMDLRRLGVLMLRSYVDGNAPLPEMSRETRQAWMYFQRRARTNWGELIVNSVVDRIVPNGITVDGANDSADAKQVQNVWMQNRMSGVFKEWLRYGMIFGQSYLTVWGGGDSSSLLRPSAKTVITADSPETMIVVTDPLQHWKPVAALRTWRNIDEARDYLIVWTQGGWQRYVRPTYTRIELKIIPSKWLVNLAEGAWTPEGQPGGQSDDPNAPIPVVVYNNPGGAGDYELHLDLINRINAGLLERLVVCAMQAFRQRAIQGGVLPEKDEHGNRIPYEDVFAPAPGALWNIPEGLEIWESEQVDVRGLLESSKDDIRQLSAVTRTPLPMLLPDNTNISAEGAKGAEASYLFRVADRLQEAKFGIEECMDLAAKVDGVDLSGDQKVEVNFANPQLITLPEKYAAALAAHNAGESWHSIMRNILGYSPDQIAQDDIDRAHEALVAASMPPLPTSVQERLTGQAPGAGPVTDDMQNSPQRAITPAKTAPRGQQPQPKKTAASGASRTKKQPASLGGMQPGGR
jgi:Phage portal protein, SPP1 Gp6-like